MPHSIELEELTVLFDEHLITYAKEAAQACMANPPCTREAAIELNDVLEAARGQRDGRISLMFEEAGWTNDEFYWYLDGMHLAQGPYNPGGIR